MALKETLYDHHPVRMVEGLALGTEQVFGGIVVLDLQTSVVGSAADTNDTGWITLDLGTYAPASARAAILDVACRDSGGAAGATYVSVGNPCGVGDPIVASKTQIVYCGDVNDRYKSRLVIALLSDRNLVNIMAIASGAALDYTIKLIGWVLDPYVAKITPPSESLFAYFVVDQ